MKPREVEMIGGVGGLMNSCSAPILKNGEKVKFREVMEHICCPFCDDDDYDLIGLKYHLENYCEPYRHLPQTASEGEKK